MGRIVNEDTYVVIPVYNEASVIGEVVRAARRHFANVVCVDDGCSDSSAAIARDAGAALVSHAVNLGAGAATQTGIEYALIDSAARYFVTIDADGQHDVADAISMLERLRAGDVDIVLGSRFLGRAEDMSRMKAAFLRLAATFSAKTTGVNLTDPHIGLRAFNRRFAENLKLTMPDFSHASELVHRIRQGRYRYAECPITVTYSAYSKAKGQPMINAVNISFDYMMHRTLKK
jgi:glycosyltransferase involved in cell wall biosynthesis